MAASTSRRSPVGDVQLPASGFRLPAVTRVLSALVLLPVVIGAIWFLPPIATLILALTAAVLAFSEYQTIARALGVSVPGGIGGTAVVLAVYAMYIGDRWVDGSSSSGLSGSFTQGWASPWVQANLVALVLMSAFIVAGAMSVAKGRPEPGALADAAATLFAPIYIGLPLGALAWARVDRWFPSAVTGERIAMGWDGRAAVLLLLAVIVISDSAQYYCGRTFGRRPLAPSISPKKTIEGGGWPMGLRVTILDARLARRDDRRAGHGRRSVRVAAQTQRGGERFVEPDPRPWRRSRSNRFVALCRSRLLHVPQVRGMTGNWQLTTGR